MSDNLRDVRMLQYHQPAFRLMERIFKEQVSHRLIEKPSQLRQNIFLEKFSANQITGSASAWDSAKECLDFFDGEMKSILSRHSAIFWLHLYRRIGVFLSPNHENKTDPATVGLVRGIVETAIQRHARIGNCNELAQSNRVSHDKILGGWMKKGFKAFHTQELSGLQLYRYQSSNLRSEPQLVIRAFNKNDFLDIYEVEGLAYQYWRITALLRSLGKGAYIKVTTKGDWQYTPNKELSRLTVSIDERNLGRNSFSSLLGVWVDQESAIEREEASKKPMAKRDTVAMVSYNVERLDMAGEYEALGFRLAKGSITNFLPFHFNAGNFLQLHNFMGQIFEQRRGYSLEIFLHTLAGLSSFAMTPDRALSAAADSDRAQILRSAFIQTASRGYYIYSGSLESLCESLANRIEILCRKKYDVAQLKTVLVSLTLQQEKQSQISLWSGGPRSLIIPGENLQLLDLASIPSVLQTLFVFMPDALGTSGRIFEQQFQNALRKRKYNVYCGELVALDKTKREMDAGVTIDDKLFIFECVSVERPLDYEIGKPITLQRRNQTLDQKLEQVRSLREFIETNPIGKNYDYSKILKIEHFVISPFVEWIGSFNQKYWAKPNHPRFMSPDEAFSLLDLQNAT